MNGTVISSTRAVGVLPSLDSLIRGVLYVFVFSLPFSPLLFVERNGFIVLCLLLVAWCVVNRRHFFTRTPLDLPWLAFVGWVAFTIPFAAFPSYSFEEFAKLLQQAFLFYVVIYFFRDRRSKTYLISVIIGALAIISFYGLMQFKDLIGKRPPNLDLAWIFSFMGAEVWLTTYLVILVPLAFSLALFHDQLWMRRGCGVITTVAMACLVATFSRAGILSLLSELWLLASQARRRIVVIVASLVTVAVVTSALALHYYDRSIPGGMRTIPWTTMSPIKTKVTSFEVRLEIWQFALSKVKENWLLGVGYGKDNYRFLYADVEKPANFKFDILTEGTHNTFLDVALSVGLPGLLLFVWLLQRTFSVTLRESRRTAASLDLKNPIALAVAVATIGIAVRVFFDHMFIGTLAIQFWVLVALALTDSSYGADSGEPIINETNK